MTDEQFDELCRSALALEPGPPSASTWSRIRPARWSWLPTVPEILACGCACGLALLIMASRFHRNPGSRPETNPVIRHAMGGSLVGLEASAVELPDPARWLSTPKL